MASSSEGIRLLPGQQKRPERVEIQVMADLTCALIGTYVLHSRMMTCLFSSCKLSSFPNIFLSYAAG
jgi:hypothetical protein